jgi:hypothetical protein
MSDDTTEYDAERTLAKSLAAYLVLMDSIVPESQYWRGEREDPERVRVLGDIITRGAARRREFEREQANGGDQSGPSVPRGPASR